MFQFGVLELCLGGQAPKSPRSDGTASRVPFLFKEDMAERSRYL